MKVTRIDILRRGLMNRCPNCGAATLFKPDKLLAVNTGCAVCGFSWDGDGEAQEGHNMRATSLNFGVTLIGYMVPLLLVAVAGKISLRTAEILAGAGALLVPLVLYRPSQSWSLMNYYFFAPEELPGPPDRSSDYRHL